MFYGLMVRGGRGGSVVAVLEAQHVSRENEGAMRTKN